MSSMLHLLTLGAHAPQGYSSWVCVCVCVCVRFDFSKPLRIGQEDLRIASALQAIDLKRGVFRKTASSRRYRIRVASVLAHLSAICLPSLAPERIYIHVTLLLSTTWCFSYGVCD